MGFIVGLEFPTSPKSQRRFGSGFTLVFPAGIKTRIPKSTQLPPRNLARLEPCLWERTRQEAQKGLEDFLSFFPTIRKAKLGEMLISNLRKWCVSVEMTRSHETRIKKSLSAQPNC